LIASSSNEMTGSGFGAAGLGAGFGAAFALASAFFGASFFGTSAFTSFFGAAFVTGAGAVDIEALLATIADASSKYLALNAPKSPCEPAASYANRAAAS
jgi:hypothetical protein